MPPKRRFYTEAENLKIIKYIRERLQEGEVAGGVAFFREMAESQKFNRTEEALRAHYRKFIIHNLKNYDFSEEEERILKENGTKKRKADKVERDQEEGATAPVEEEEEDEGCMGAVLNIEKRLGAAALRPQLSTVSSTVLNIEKRLKELDIKDKYLWDQIKILKKKVGPPKENEMKVPPPSSPRWTNKTNKINRTDHQGINSGRKWRQTCYSTDHRRLSEPITESISYLI